MKAESRRALKIIFLASLVAAIYGILLYAIIPYINEYLHEKKLISIIIVSTVVAPILIAWFIYKKTIRKWSHNGNSYIKESGITITIIFSFFSSIALIIAVEYAK